MTARLSCSGSHDSRARAAGALKLRRRKLPAAYSGLARCPARATEHRHALKFCVRWRR